MSMGAVETEASPYARGAPELLALGYHPLPIVPGEKMPGDYRNGVWRPMSNWQRFRDKQPSEFERNLWMRNWPGAGLGLVLGSPAGAGLHIIAMDVDVDGRDELDELLGQLPPSPMRKLGAKGETRFYRASKEIRTRAYSRASDRHRLADLLTGFDTRQTVCPPSRHPSGMDYAWTAGPVAAAALPVFDSDDLEKFEEALFSLGWDPDAERVSKPQSIGGPSSAEPSDDPWQDVKVGALADMDAWVPALDLYGCRRARSGYEAVPHWRPSCTGRPIEKRKRNLSIQPNGIKDFGDGFKGYSAIDLVAIVRGISPGQAADWLTDRLGLGGDVVIDLKPRSPPMVEHVNPATGEVSQVDPLGRPFVWRDPATIPRREFLYGQHLIRQFMSCTFAPGGVGKSALGLAEACAMASGKPLLGVQPAERLRVWVWSGEDPKDETDRRIAALTLHYGLDCSDLEGWLFLGSGRETDIVIAKQTRDGAIIQDPEVARVMQFMRLNSIDVALIDPFVSTHRATENDNNAIDLVAKRWAKIAGDTGSAIDLVHHTSKPQAQSEMTVEHGRGASALLYAARSARVLNVMSEAEAAKASVERRRSYFRSDNGKANLAPPPDGSDWFKFESISLGNGGLEGGDSVGVVTAWKWPDAFVGVQVMDLVEIQRRVAVGSYRANFRSSDWVGHVVAEVLELDLQDPSHLAKAKALLANWTKEGLFKTEMRMGPNRHEKPYVAVGKMVEL